jgi:hypothetical protein
VTQHTHHITIDRSPEEVMAYACTPFRWPEWHPNSVRVYAPDGVLPAGTLFEEDIFAGGRKGHLCWDIQECTPTAPPLRWVAKATGMPHKLRMEVIYECRPSGSGAVFSRTLHYQLPGLVMRVLNFLVLKRRIERESAESLNKLRDKLQMVKK